MAVKENPEFRPVRLVCFAALSGLVGKRFSVVVADSDPLVRAIVGKALVVAGYGVRFAADGHDVLAEHRSRPADLVVMDTELGGLDGRAVLRDLRGGAGGGPGVLFLSARASEWHRTTALLAGADDFMAKPFAPREVAARVGAILRRVTQGLTGVEPVAPLEAGPLRIDCAGRRVTVDGVELRLTQREFDLLAFLARSPGRAHSRASLMQSVWGYHEFTDASTVTVHVRRLRSKLSGHTQGESLIRTVHGIGYSFEPTRIRSEARRV